MTPLGFQIISPENSKASYYIFFRKRENKNPTPLWGRSRQICSRPPWSIASSRPARPTLVRPCLKTIPTPQLCWYLNIYISGHYNFKAKDTSRKKVNTHKSLCVTRIPESLQRLGEKFHMQDRHPKWLNIIYFFMLKCTEFFWKYLLERGKKILHTRRGREATWPGAHDMEKYKSI